MNSSVPNPVLSPTDPVTGLSSEEVRTRREHGFSNIHETVKSKTFFQIIREHLFTLFNLINIVMGLVLIFIGSYKNTLFMGVVLCNTAIGIFHEIRAKIETDKLVVETQTKVTVKRDGILQEISTHEIVYGDLLQLKTGDMIPVGCVILKGTAEANEALITGESDPVFKSPGDRLLPGSYLISGDCTASADQVGKDSLLHEMVSGSKKLRNRNSQIIQSLRKIIDIITLLIIPFSVLFYWMQTTKGIAVPEALKNTVAALVGMIPEGLILLVSSVMAIAVFKLSKKRVLVKELYSVEILARTDTVCLDKTGTITDGTFRVVNLVPFHPSSSELKESLSAIVAASGESNIMKAITEYLGETDHSASLVIPFTSERKYSVVQSMKNRCLYIFGAPEVVFRACDRKESDMAGTYAEKYRVLCVAKSPLRQELSELPEEREPVGLLILTERIRDGASDTIAYFQRQNIDVKLISGDNPVTVSHIAGIVGVNHSERYCDMRQCQKDTDYCSLVNQYVIFGRCTPQQKKSLIEALKSQGHVVAMTGDGVNDILAMRESNVSIAINEGADAARNVSDMVMLNSDYASLPDVIYEGRKAINNLEKAASLFLIKTTYSILLGIAFLFLSSSYPMVPIQLTLINAILIAIPSLFISLHPSKEKISGSFIFNALRKAVPIGISIAGAVILISVLGKVWQIPSTDISAIASYSIAICVAVSLFWIMAPLDFKKIAVSIGLIAFYSIISYLMRVFFEMSVTSVFSWLLLLAGIATAAVLFAVCILVEKVCLAWIHPHGKNK